MLDFNIQHVLILAILICILYLLLNNTICNTKCNTKCNIDGFSVGGRKNNLRNEINELQNEKENIEGKPCNVGDRVSCPNGGFCAGNQCCEDGSTCPSASNTYIGCDKSKLYDCTSEDPLSLCQDNIPELLSFKCGLNAADMSLQRCPDVLEPIENQIIIQSTFKIERHQAYKLPEGHYYIEGLFVNDGILCIGWKTGLYINNKFENNGIININPSFSADLGIFIQGEGKINNTSRGTINNFSIISNKNQIINHGTITNYVEGDGRGGAGSIHNENDGNINNYGYITNNWKIINENAATITNYKGATITNNSYIYNNNTATITNSSGATITNSSGATISNCATFNNSGEITNEGYICSIRTRDMQNVKGTPVEVCDSHICKNK